MHARVNTHSGVTNVDAGLAYLSEGAEELAQMAGYQGLVASGDRAAGKVTGISLWETLANLEASASAAVKTRQSAVDAFGGSVTVEVFEVEYQERAGTPPVLGNPLVVRRARTDPAHLEAALAYNRDVTIPAVKAQPGFKAVMVLLDRERCEAMVGVMFDGYESLMAARQAIEASADEGARSVGVEVDPPEIRELLFAHMP